MLSSGTSEVMETSHTLPLPEGQAPSVVEEVALRRPPVVEEVALRPSRNPPRPSCPRHRHRIRTSAGCSLDPPVGGDRSLQDMNSPNSRADAGWGPLAVLMGGIFLVV